MQRLNRWELEICVILGGLFFIGFLVGWMCHWLYHAVIFFSWML
jgi:hypothetical protein